MFGDLVGGIIRTVNAPLRAADRIITDDDETEIVSAPLAMLAEAIEDAWDEED